MLSFALDPTIAMADRASLSRADRARALNDDFRRSLEGGKVMITPGVAALSDESRLALMWAVRLFEDFTPENDPYEEHDFGAVTIKGERYLWKIDCFDLDLAQASPDASDPAFTIRVLTIMRGDEY